MERCVYDRPASDTFKSIVKTMLEGLSTYKQLQYGQLVRVYPNLVKRLKQHFSTLEECGSVGMIIGCNGYIWIVSASDQTKQKRKQRNASKTGRVPHIVLGGLWSQNKANDD